MKTNHYAFCLVAVLLCGCAGMSAEQGAAIVVGGASAFTLFVQDLLAAGVINEATAAKLMASAGAIRDITEATRAAIGPIADAVGQLQVKSASAWTTPEVTTGLGAAIALAVGTVRAWRGPAAAPAEKAKRLSGAT